MKTMLLLGAIIAMTPSCSSTLPSVERAESALQHVAENTDEQSQCFKAWGRIVDDWKQHSGGVGDSLEQTRLRIARDKNSAFSALAREVWKSQVVDQKIDFGSWPVDPAIERSVAKQIDSISEGFVTKECSFHIFASAALFEELRLADADSGYRRLTEVPANIEWDPYSGSRYLLFWLFVADSH